MTAVERSDRRKERLVVSIGQGLGSAAIETETYDFSQGGFYVATGDNELAIGERVAVRVSNSDAEDPVTIQCEVVWVDKKGSNGRPPGAGLKFLSDSPEVGLVDKLNQVITLAERRLYQHPIWKQHASSNCPEHIALGWLIEQYHLQLSLFDHMSIAIRRAPDVSIKRVLTKHLYAQRNRPIILLDVLASMGITKESVIESRPLSSTASCCAHLIELAHCDLLSYVATVGFGEPRGLFTMGDGALPRATAEILRRAVDAMRSVRALSNNVFSLVPAVSMPERKRAIDALEVWFELYAMMMDNMGSYYVANATIPRLPASRSLHVATENTR